MANASVTMIINMNLKLHGLLVEMTLEYITLQRHIS